MSNPRERIAQLQQELNTLIGAGAAHEVPHAAA